MFRTPAFRRLLTTAATTAPAAATEAAPAAAATFRNTPLPPPKKPVGAIRGGVIGFLLGIVLAGTAGYYYLVDDYQVYSNALLNNVEQLGGSVESIRASLKKADKLEAEVKALKDNAAKRDELEKARKEMLKALDNLTIEHLELKTRVWAAEQDIKKH
ncbi:hypothetical protein AMAG_12200 [Allomyces macrogynus ATCC 38327]|uniref:Uncharacterized protein n=1 Tax=Allomyces macrogynus (strain ATCC 38327) TaxID=578462 RepID=A0A0L0SX95_ALLM3|nr:hypothetical protein AMAG_12200 [Allomyces macrogynus ATCC 38327]|eukprot:KNE67127.1 hypothetical protein AMAG_12200 [Allomyces macrogynus ATCC 38327]